MSQEKSIEYARRVGKDKEAFNDSLESVCINGTATDQRCIATVQEDHRVIWNIQELVRSVWNLMEECQKVQQVSGEMGDRKK